jgi:hypothetical protein
VFDLVHQRLGLADAACPEHRQQPDILEEAAWSGPVGTSWSDTAGADDDLAAEGLSTSRRFSTSVLLTSVLLVSVGATAVYLAVRAAACRGGVLGFLSRGAATPRRVGAESNGQGPGGIDHVCLTTEDPAATDGFRQSHRLPHGASTGEERALAMIYTNSRRHDGK